MLSLLRFCTTKIQNVKGWILKQPYDNILSFGLCHVVTSLEWEDGFDWIYNSEEKPAR